MPDQRAVRRSTPSATGVDTLQSHTTKSINCAFVRLSQIVGLNRVVDTTYRMAESPYLYQDQPASERRPIDPFVSFATGANEMSPLDMAAGVQTLANEGLHHEPYYVEFIDGPDGERVHTHLDPGSQVLGREAALQTVEILKGPIYGGGTGRRAAFDDRRPAFGKTGTQEDNTNAWFVGGTKQLSTAVWVGDPDSYTRMEGIPEFNAVGVNKVQGGLFPAQIWGAFMTPAHENLLQIDWDAPLPPERSNARLVLPGNECSLRQVGTRPGGLAPTTVPDEPVETVVVDPENPIEAVPPETLPAIPVFEKVQLGTTIPPDVLDPNAGLPLVAVNDNVGPC